MQTIFTIFKAYCGSGFFPLIYLAALVWLLFTEKKKPIRIVLVYTSLIITVLFFCPLFYWGMEKLDEGTYYRILWMLPMSVVIAYAGVQLFSKYLKLGFIAMAAVIILTGSLVYRNVNMSIAQNRYHIPNSVIAICNDMLPEEDEERVWAVFPDELIHFVRQYTSEVQMPYGREMLVPSWEWNWDTHPIYRIMRENPIDLNALNPLFYEYDVQYLVLNRAVPTIGDPKENHFELIDQIEGYDVYRYTEVEIWKKEYE